jgi:Tfp pilus assembly protein PilO
MTLTSSQRPRSLPRSSLVTASVATAALLYILFVFVPGQRSLAQLRREVREKQQHVLQSDRLAVPIQSSEDKLRTIENFAEKQRSQLPSAAELLKSLGKISEQAKLAGVTLRRVDPQPAVKLETLQQLPVELHLEGDFSQMFDFIQRLEQLPFTIWVRKLRVGENEGKSGALQTELSLTIFGDLADQADSSGVNVRY